MVGVGQKRHRSTQAYRLVSRYGLNSCIRLDQGLSCGTGDNILRASISMSLHALFDRRAWAIGPIYWKLLIRWRSSALHLSRLTISQTRWRFSSPDESQGTHHSVDIWHGKQYIKLIMSISRSPKRMSTPGIQVFVQGVAAQNCSPEHCPQVMPLRNAKTDVAVGGSGVMTIVEM